MTDHFLDAIEAKGNGFAIGEVTGPDVGRWIEFVEIRFRATRRSRDGRPL